LEESGIVVEDSGISGGVAKNEEAYSILDSPVHREQFLDEIYEVGGCNYRRTVRKIVRLLNFS
jgi:hypothetical protein